MQNNTAWLIDENKNRMISEVKSIGFDKIAGLTDTQDGLEMKEYIAAVIDMTDAFCKYIEKNEVLAYNTTKFPAKIDYTEKDIAPAQELPEPAVEKETAQDPAKPKHKTAESIDELFDQIFTDDEPKPVKKGPGRPKKNS